MKIKTKHLFLLVVVLCLLPQVVPVPRVFEFLLQVWLQHPIIGQTLRVFSGLAFLLQLLCITVFSLHSDIVFLGDNAHTNKKLHAMHAVPYGYHALLGVFGFRLSKALFFFFGLGSAALSLVDLRHVSSFTHWFGGLMDATVAVCFLLSLSVDLSTMERTYTDALRAREPLVDEGNKLKLLKRLGIVVVFIWSTFFFLVEVLKHSTGSNWWSFSCSLLILVCLSISFVSLQRKGDNIARPLS